MAKIYANILEWDILFIEEITQENEPDELMDNLNPKYFEEVITLKDAKNMIFSQSSSNESIYNIFRVF